MPQCSGALDEHNRPICDGPDVRQVRVRYFGEEEISTTHWCSDCRGLAVAQEGHTIIAFGEENK